MTDTVQNFIKPRKKNALDNRKLNLTAPCPTAQGKTSSLIWGVYSNNPRITVYTGDPEDSSERTGYGRIAANLDVPTFFAFVEMLERIAKGPVDVKDKIENKNYTWFGGKRSEVPVIVSNLWVGKDKDGAVWISVMAENRPIIKFIISPSDFHCLFHGDGSPFTKGESSSLYAIGYCSILRNIVSNVLVNDYVEDAPRQQNQGNNRNGNGGYNNNKQSNNTGGYQPRPAQDTTFNNDIPF